MPPRKQFEYEYPPIDLADAGPQKPTLTTEEAAALAEEKRKAKAKNPLSRVHASPLVMGIPPQTQTTTQYTTQKTEVSRRNVKLMNKLAMIDESAQRLQAMLREETASVPGRSLLSNSNFIVKN